MVDLKTIKDTVQVVKNAQGEPVVQMPLALWESVLNDIETKQQISQAEKIQALLDTWESEPDDNSLEWWAEFDKFLRENRVNFPERDFNLGDE